MKEEKKEEVGTEQRCQRKQNKKMRKPVKNKIKIAPDSKYNSVRVAKFINYVMERGKKNTARNIVYQSFQNVKEKTKKDPLVIFESGAIFILFFTGFLIFLFCFLWHLCSVPTSSFFSSFNSDSI